MSSYNGFVRLEVAELEILALSAVEFKGSGGRKNLSLLGIC